jgi:hypothetical protein
MPVTSRHATEIADLHALLAELEAIPRVGGMWDAVKRTVVKVKDKNFVNRDTIMKTLKELITANTQLCVIYVAKSMDPTTMMFLKSFKDCLEEDFDPMKKKQYVEKVLAYWKHIRPRLLEYKDKISTETIAYCVTMNRCIRELQEQMQLYENRWKEEL